MDGSKSVASSVNSSNNNVVVCIFVTCVCSVRVLFSVVNTGFHETECYCLLLESLYSISNTLSVSCILQNIHVVVANLLFTIRSFTRFSSVIVSPFLAVLVVRTERTRQNSCRYMPLLYCSSSVVVTGSLCYSILLVDLGIM